MSLWQSVVLFGEAVCATAQQYMGDEAQRQSLLTMFQPLTHPDTEASVDAAVRAYFEQPPAHVAAVNSLDHTQFMHALVIPNVCSIPLRDVLEAFSCLGPIPYGRIWLHFFFLQRLPTPPTSVPRMGGITSNSRCPSHPWLPLLRPHPFHPWSSWMV